MMYVRRRLIGSVLFLMATLSTHAQVEVDPTDNFYYYLERWQALGYIESPPLYRPYPLEEVVAILRTVEQRANGHDALQAERLLAAIETRRSVHTETGASVFTRDDEIQPKWWLRFIADVPISDSVHVSGSVGGYAIERGAEDLIPAGTRSVDDVLEDNSKFTVRGVTVHTLMQAFTQGTWRGDEWYFQAGIMRRSFGPAWGESPVVSELAPQSGNAVFEWRRNKFRYTASMFALTATQPFRDITDPTDKKNIDLNGDGIDDVEDKNFIVPGKYLYLHAASYPVRPWLDLTFFEAIVFGPRMELTYFIPAKILWHAQATANYTDNAFLGGSADIRPARRWRIPITGYLDDINWNDLLGGNLDTKIKAAGAASVQYAPPGQLAALVELRYEAVFPYMYTHAVTNAYDTEPNYLNYLHQNENFGTSLLPNSDRFTLATTLRPNTTSTLELSCSLIRHGNASEGILDQIINDGGYGDNGREGEYVWLDTNGDSINDELIWVPGDFSYQSDLRFLDQEHIETTYQAGVRGTVAIPLRRSVASVQAGYTFEYISNPLDYRWDESTGVGDTVVGSDIVNHYGELTLAFRW